jgi:hypothetical protein
MYAAGGPQSLLFLRRRIVNQGVEDPPVNVDLPDILGDPFVNFPLALSTGNWTGDPSEYHYQWLRRLTGTAPFVLIDGANLPAYALAEDDVTNFVAGSVTAINGFGEATAISLEAGPIVGVAPANTVAPTVTGGSSPPKVGETVTANTGTWTGVPAPGLAVQWRRGSADIVGAVASTLRLTASDFDNMISVRIVGTNSAGAATVTSAAVGPIAAGTDATVPVLSAFSVEPDGELAAFMSVVTSKGDGTFYWVVVPDGSTAPSAAQIVAGTDGGGTPATSSGSVLVASITTYGPNPTGLSAGSVYDAYCVMYDAVGNVSNILTDQFTTAGSDVPTLSAEAVVDFADNFIIMKASTNSGHGGWYAVSCPAAATPPNGAQIAAGTDGSGNPCPHASVASTSTGEKTIQVRGLTQNTAYKTYLVHKVGSSYSNILNVSHTSDIFVASWANTGATAGLSSVGGVFTANQSDPYGGTTAIRWADINDGASPGGVSLVGGVIFGVGMVKFHYTEKWTGGAEFRRVSPMINVDAPALSTHWNTRTGAQGYNVGFAGSLPLITNVGGGWYLFSTQKTLPGPDTNGGFTFLKSMLDNALGSITRDGTHVSYIHDIRATRAAA